MKKSKFSCIVAALLVFALVLAACGNDPTPTPTPTPTPQTVETVAPAQTTDNPPVVHSEPPRDIRIVSWYLHGLHGAAPFETPDPNEAADYEMARMQYDNLRAVEERFNVRIVHEETMDYETHLEIFLAQQMAGDPIGEIVLLSGQMMLTAIQGGHLTDLATLQFPGSDLHGNREYIIATVEQDGSIWQVNMNTGGAVWDTVGLTVNMDLVNRLGLTDPIALYESGQWTWDNMLSIMRTASAQGYFGISGVTNDIGNLLIASNDGIMVTPDLNYGFDHPNTMVALEFFHTLMDERLWNYDRYGEVPVPEDDWWRQMTGFYDGTTVFASTYLWVPDMAGGTDIDFRVMPFPLGPNNTTGNTWAQGMPQAVVIPAGVEDPTLVLQVMEALMAWPAGETWMILEAVKGGVRDSLLTEEDVIRWVDIAGNQRGADAGFDVPDYRYVFSDFSYDFFHGIRTVAEAVEYQRGPRQEMLDNMFR